MQNGMLDTSLAGGYKPPPLPGPAYLCVDVGKQPTRHKAPRLRVGEIAGVAQSVEHLPCKQGVKGSSPLASSIRKRTGKELREVRKVSVDSSAFFLEGCPSGQREQTVNLPALPSMVRIHHPPLGSRGAGSGEVEGLANRTIASRRRKPCGSSSVGRASAFQAERRRFESGLPLYVPRIQFT